MPWYDRFSSDGRASDPDTTDPSSGSNGGSGSSDSGAPTDPTDPDTDETRPGVDSGGFALGLLTAGFRRGRSTTSRRVRSLVTEHRYREALEILGQSDDEDAGQWSTEISHRAAVHWLSEAELACNRDDRKAMNAALAEAARYYRDDLGPVFREARRRIRARILELTIATHWVVLLHAASDQRAAHFTGAAASVPPASWKAFENRRLLKSAARRMGLETLDATALDRLDAKTLDKARKSVRKAYPDALHAYVDQCAPEFLRAALHVASCRPDLAVLPLLELPTTEPLVCLERARVAFSLGFPGTAMLALSDFRTNHGEHLAVRRLHTGVFMAQMAVQCGDLERAVEILDELPLGEVGRRPVLLFAELLAETGELTRAHGVLGGWLSEHPDDDEARERLAALPDPAPGAASDSADGSSDYGTDQEHPEQPWPS